MTKELFVEYAQEAGLVVISQTIISWSEIEHLDCISVFRKPCNGDTSCEEIVQGEEAKKQRRLETSIEAKPDAQAPSSSNRMTWAFKTLFGIS